MMMRLLAIGLLFVVVSAAAQEKAAPPPCQPYPECVLTSSRLVPAAPNTGIHTQKQPPIGITTDKGPIVPSISPLDRSTFRVPSLGKGVP